MDPWVRQNFGASFSKCAKRNLLCALGTAPRPLPLQRGPGAAGGPPEGRPPGGPAVRPAVGRVGRCYFFTFQKCPFSLYFLPVFDDFLFYHLIIFFCIGSLEIPIYIPTM